MIRTFGPFRLDPQTGELSRNGYRLRLQPQPMRILVMLTDAPEKLVTRQDIRQRVWGDDTFVDFDQSLNFAIHQIRLVLSDSADIPKYIETVPKRGYRFIAEVQELVVPDVVQTAQAEMPQVIAEATPSEASSTVDSLPLTADLPAEFTEVTMPRRRASDYPDAVAMRRWTYTAIGAVICLVAAIVFFALSHRQQAEVMPVADQNIAIAVLPFANLTGDPAKDYISDGFTDEVMARLAKLDPTHLRVTAHTSAMAYKGDKDGLRKIAQDLKVNYIVRGSIQLEDNRMRVIAHLVKVQGLQEIWSNAFEDDRTRVFRLESTVAEAIVHELPLRLPPGPFHEPVAPSVQANDEYMEGLEFLSQRSKTGFEAAVQSFSHAIQANPKYSSAYAQLANTYNLMGQYNWITTGEAHSLGKAAAMQALAIDPSLSGAHTALGFSKWFYEWDIPGGENEFMHAIALNPSDVNAHHWYSNLLMTAGRFPEAEQQMRLAIQLDPRALILKTNLGWIHYTEQNFTLAAKELRTVLDENPNFVTAHYKLWYAYGVQGDDIHAWREFDRILEMTATPQHHKAVADEYSRHGYAKAMQLAAVTDDPAYVGSTVDAARCMMFAGRKQEAMQKLSEAYEAHEGWMIFVATDPGFDELHSDAGFQRLMKKVRAA